MNSINKIILGLTGYYCSGKTSVEEVLKEKHNFFIIDVDKIGHWALEKKKKELENEFGDIIIKDNKIDRKTLGEIVFKDKKKLSILNSIVHPIMIEKVKEEIGKNNNKICINAAILFEMNLHKFCSSVIIVKSSFFNIIKRAKKRDRASIIKVFRIIKSQKIMNQIKKEKKYADICYINNNKDINYIEEQLKNVLIKRKIV